MVRCVNVNKIILCIYDWNSKISIFKIKNLIIFIDVRIIKSHAGNDN